MLMTNTDKETRMKLLQFARKYGNSLGRFLVLQFWGKHPQTHFSLPCIKAAFDGKKLDLSEALGMLVDEGIVEETATPRGVTLYSLTNNPEKREPIMALAKLDWEQAQKLSYLVSHHWPASHVLAQA